MSLYPVIVLFVAVLLLKENEGCFTSTENHTIYMEKGTAFYGECACTTPGYDVRHLKWLDRLNQEIGALRPGTDQKAYTERQSDSISLHIPNVVKAKSGIYRCVTNFEGREYTQNYYIIAYEPVTINPPEEQFIILGNRSLVKCKVHAEDESKVITSWSKAGEDDKRTPITASDKYTITEDGLYINDVVDEDKGKYSCSAIDKETHDEVDKDINVKIITRPVIKDLKVGPFGPRIVAGETLVMECIGDGIPHPEYIWRKTDTGVMDNPRWKQEVNAIMIDPVLPEDQGPYECIAQSMAGVVTREVFIEVLFAPNITSFPSMEAVEGSTVELVCNAIGRPAPNISIIFIGQDDDDIRDLDENDIMDNLSFIKKIDRSQEGFYVCNASNEVNFTLEEMYLSVYYKPRFEASEEIVWTWDGQLVNLTCLPDSNPPANFTWRFLGDDIPTSKQVEMNTYLHNAMYSTASFYLPVNISENLFLYGTYECNATNPLGGDTKLIHLREGYVPPTIRNATAVYITPTSATFYIEHPDSFQGPPILGYTAEYDILELYNITNIHNNRTWSAYRPFTIENLRADTSYIIRFSAINMVGNGGWSDYMEFETLEPSVPSEPMWETNEELFFDDIINVTDTSQAITWKAPDNNGAPVDYYTLKYCAIDKDVPCEEHQVEPTTELKVDLSLLEHNTTYFIELVAHNYMGNSTPANITISMPAKVVMLVSRLSAGALIGISVVIVFLCLVLLDVLLLLWRRQGILAACCYRKKKNKEENNLQTRDKKGLLKDSHDDSERRPDNSHKEFEYNKTTGIITGKHSAV